MQRIFRPNPIENLNWEKLELATVKIDGTSIFLYFIINYGAPGQC